MSNQVHLQKFQDKIAQSVSSNTFIKISLGNYQGNEKELKNIYVRLVKIKRVKMLSFTYRYKTRDVIKNFQIEEGLALISHFVSNDFKASTLFIADKEIILQYGKKDQISIIERSLGKTVHPVLLHNKEKKRLIKPSGKSYLKDLGITDAEGNVFKSAQDKYRQINQYIEILSSLIKELPVSGLSRIVDMGSGKGYLTFALYDYLHQVLNVKSSVTGIEFREDLVKLCNAVAADSGFEQLNFVQGSIADYAINEIDILIALHACDTATDDAIYKGIEAGAQLIVVAPCCHKQIRREMEKYSIKNEVSFLTKYGIFLERQAEMITDGIRALILEYFGYKTKVIEFISDAHTPKNVLVVGLKTKEVISEQKKAEILKKINDSKAYFGIGFHHLESVLNLNR